MFIAMNRFKIAPGSEADFEQVWATRETHLAGVPGFRAFHLARGPEREDQVLYATHTVWDCEAAFQAWTTSEAFRKAHRNAGDNRSLYLDRPEFEGFTVVLSSGPQPAMA